MEKYTIYLPLKYNDGTDIEPEKFKEVKTELTGMFGGLTVSSSIAPFEGVWQYKETQFIDKIVKFEVITARDRKIEKFFRDYKAQLKKRFRQLDILVTMQDIQTL